MIRQMTNSLSFNREGGYSPFLIIRRTDVFFVVSDVFGGSSVISSDSAGVDSFTSVKRSDVKKILKIRPACIVCEWVSSPP